MPVSDIIKLRRGTASTWTSVNPTLAAGEPGFETDTGNVKIGTGAAAWTALSYTAGPAVSTSLGNVSTSLGNVSTSLGNVSTSLANVSTSLTGVSTALSATNSTALLISANASAANSAVASLSTADASQDAGYSTSLSTILSTQTLLSTSESSTIARLTNVSTSASTIQSTLTSGVSIIGAVTSMNGIATVANGIPAEYAVANLTTQGAAIAATTIYTTPASGAGLYRVSFNAKVTRAATTSSTLGGFQVRYTDATDSVVTTTVASATNTGNTTGANIGGVMVVHAAASTNIQYIMGYVSSGATTMQYKLNVLVERI